MSDSPTHDDSSTAAVAQPWVSPDGAVLSVLSGGAVGAVVRLPGGNGGVVRVGKAKENDLVLPDSTVSRHHLTITRTETGLLVQDLDSRNGVRVAGVRVKEATVEPGTILLIGDTEVLVKIELRGAVIPPSPSERFQRAFGRSLVMRRIFGLLERMAKTDATVLLMGETGTGKDVLARSIHLASARVGGPFEVVDCGAIAPTLIESELFGHEKGAFTNAVASREGAFERAAGGTLFLDEIGELPLGLQPKLLRAIDAREIRRVGGNKTIQVKVRIVAATTRDLAQEVEDGRFRQDLYFRLAVVPIHVPPLRARLEDIGALAQILLENDPDLSALTLGPEVLAALRSYAWPGNVRELRNVLERAAHLTRGSGGTVIEHIDVAPTRDIAMDDVYRFEDGISYRQARSRVEAHFEVTFVRWLLANHKGNVSAAARAAKMDRKYLADLVRKHRLA